MILHVIKIKINYMSMSHHHHQNVVLKYTLTHTPRHLLLG
jgi:hypothetical protein